MTTENPDNPSVLILSSALDEGDDKYREELRDHVVSRSSLETQQVGIYSPEVLGKMSEGLMITEGTRLVIVHAIRPREVDKALGLAVDAGAKLGQRSELGEISNNVALYGSLWGNISRAEKSHLRGELKEASIDPVYPYYGENGNRNLYLMDWLLQRGVDLSPMNGNGDLIGASTNKEHLLITDRRERWQGELTKLWSDQTGLLRSRILVRDLDAKDGIKPNELVELCRNGLRNVLVHMTNSDNFDRVLDFLEATGSIELESQDESAEGEALQTALRMVLFSEKFKHLFPNEGERSIAHELVKDSGVLHTRRDPSWSVDGEVPSELKAWMKGKN